MNNELITIVVPVYNTEKYLGECLDSLLCQTYDNIKIICINDGSKDNSQAVLNEYVKKDKRVSAYEFENAGAATARNRGIDIFLKNNDSNYITFVDSDDVLDKHCIEFLYHTIIKYNADVSTCDWKYYGKLDKSNLESQCYSKEETLYLYFVDKVYTESPVHRLFKKETFINLRFPDGKCFEDTFISYKLIESFNKIAHINYSGYEVRLRGDSSTGKEYSNNNYDKVIAGLEIYNYYKDTKFEKLAYNKYLGILYYFIIKTNAIKDKVSKNEVAIKDAKKIAKEKGFKNAKLKFYPFILATKLNFIDKIRI